ncbi:MAG: hypothetical protein DI534_01800 [Leifsonia xyli]|nr:MAG: hypothetical protein DI534_01800 [Leifsonia xyli]
MDAPARSPRRRRLLLIFVVAFAAIAVVVAGAFVVTSLQREELMRTGEQVEASPTGDYVTRSGSNEKKYYYIVWGYTVEGREYTIVGTERYRNLASVRSDISRLADVAVTAFYDPADPSRAVLGEVP